MNKCIGGEQKIYKDTYLIVIVKWNREIPDDLSTEYGPVVNQTYINLTVSLLLYDRNDRLGYVYNYHMKSRGDMCQDIMRKNFLNNNYWSGEIFADSEVDINSIVSVDIHDPYKILDWLYPEGNFKNFAKEKYNQKLIGS